MEILLGNFWARAGEILGGKSGENLGERQWKALKSIGEAAKNIILH